MQDPKQIRRDIREQRRLLSQRQQRQHSRAAARLVAGWFPYLKARHVAVYFDTDGELGLESLVSSARRCGKSIYLPVLHPFSDGKLWFSEWREFDRLQLNRYGIPEPVPRERKQVLPCMLDMVLVPLVAFDRSCFRLGMGGGYYDRTFAYRKSRLCWRRPMLVGVAHDLQRLERIDVNPWDISLDAVITERQIYQCKMSSCNAAKKLA